MKKRQLMVNEAASRVMVHCSSLVNRDAISRESIGGVEHIRVTSYTLPDDIVMNRGLYPSEEVAPIIESLNNTLAPIGHPTDENGQYISANLPEAIHNFHGGAFNANVTREGNRYRVDKMINVQEAMKSDRGKRLLDRINELETSDTPRPIHTSVGVWMTPEELEEPKVNAAGDEYDWIGRNMVIDHDAILLDEAPAANPSQGVGMAINADGKTFQVESVVLDTTDKKLSDNEMSFEERRNALQSLLENMINDPEQWVYVMDFYDDRVIYKVDGGEIMAVDYSKDEVSGQLSIVGIPQPQAVTYIPKVNQKGDVMKELILNALKAKGIDIEGLSDDQLLAKYNELQANDDTPPADNGNNDDVDAVTAAVNAAVTPLVEKVDAIETRLNANTNAEVDDLASTVATSGLYPNLDVESAKQIPLETLKGMAANCKTSVGLGHHLAPNSESGGNGASYDAPE